MHLLVFFGKGCLLGFTLGRAVIVLGSTFRLFREPAEWGDCCCSLGDGDIGAPWVSTLVIFFTASLADSC